MTDPAFILDVEPPAAVAVPAFRVGPQVFSLDDILASAGLRGELAQFRGNWEGRRAAAAVAEACGMSPAAADIEAATDAFRYARDLVSAEECDRWLARRGLVFADLTASMTRRVQAELTPPDEPPEPPGFGSDDDGDFRTDALLADEFTGWARGLAWRLALAREHDARPADRGDLADRWPELEERFTAACAALAKPERRRRELATQRLELLRLEIAAAEFESEAAAREAFLCAREDGTALAAVAEANGFPVCNYEAFLGDLTPDWQQALVSATPGDVTPPLTGGGTAVVLQLLGKHEPSIEDAAVCARLDADLRRQHFGELEAKHIRWLLNVEVEA